MTDPVRYKLKIKIYGPEEMLDKVEEILFSHTPRLYKLKRNEERIKVKIFLTEDQREVLISALKEVDEAHGEETFHYFSDEWQ